MNERFTRVFSVQERLYAENSPVYIEAAALTKDNQTGRIFAQLKFQNITDQVIKAIKINLFCKDIVGNLVGEAVPYQYLDLTVKNQEEFGGKVAIAIPEVTTRSFDIQIDEVIFEDLSSISLLKAHWEPLPKDKKPLSDVLDEELLEQYRYENTNAHFVPTRYKDLWLCTCGQYNKNNCGCSFCGDSERVLSSIDRDALKKAYEERKEAEARQAEKDAKIAAEEAKKTKKNAIIGTIIGVPCIILLIVCSLIGDKINRITKADPYDVLEEKLIEMNQEFGFETELGYSFWGNKITITAQQIEEPENPYEITEQIFELEINTAEPITINQYNSYIQLIRKSETIVEEAYTDFRAMSYDLDIELNYYMNDDSKTQILSVLNGKQNYFIIDLEKEKDRLIPAMEKEIEEHLDKKEYSDLCHHYFGEKILESGSDESYIYLNDSPKFLPAKIYATQMNAYYNSIYLNHKDLENILDNLDTLDENYRDVKQLKKSIRSYYNIIMSFKGKYYKPDDIWDKEFVVVKNGTITPGYISRGIEKTDSTSYYIRLKRENEKLNYFCGSGKLTITGSTLKIEGDTIGWLDGTYTK